MKLANAKVHCIGVGGIGMSGLAELLHSLGSEVSGSDLGENSNTECLKSLGIKIFKGHHEDHLGPVDVVVYSSAITPKNCEYQKARSLGIPLIPRTEALAEIMRLKRGVVVAGTHGKTTTTSMIASIFLKAQKDPTIAVGGRLSVISSNAKLGKGEWMIAESDESDGSFLRLYPEVAVITNIDNDHLDYYGDLLSLKNAFYRFACNIPFYGALVCYGDDREIREIMAPFSKKILFYGFHSENDFVLSQVGDSTSCEYEIKCQENSLFNATDLNGTRFQVPIPGAHNALNALAAILASRESGLSIEQSIEGLKSFEGVGRRFETKGTWGSVSFYDDYAHHPTELKAVFGAFRSRFPERRLVAFFEPHRYTRMKECWENIITVLKTTDLVFVSKVYEASEDPIPGISGFHISEAIGEKAIYLNVSTKATLSELEPWFLKIHEFLKPDDIFVTLGAGKINVVGENLLSFLNEKFPQ